MWRVLINEFFLVGRTPEGPALAVDPVYSELISDYTYTAGTMKQFEKSNKLHRLSFVLCPLSFVLSSISSRRVHHARRLTFYFAACSLRGMAQSKQGAPGW